MTRIANQGQAAVEPPRATMTAQQIADELQWTLDHFQNRRPALEAAGFPRRLPGTARWSRAAVFAWIDGAERAAAIEGAAA